MRKNSLLWGWLSTGRGCSEVLWSFHLWRSSKAAWAQLWVTCPQEPCLRRQAGLEDLQWSIPRPTIPWLCGALWSYTGRGPLPSMYPYSAPVWHTGLKTHPRWPRSAGVPWLFSRMWHGGSIMFHDGNKGYLLVVMFVIIWNKILKHK